MTLLDELLDANGKAVQRSGELGSFVANRHLCIVTCVDPRLTRWFSSALGVERGHAVAIRIPGARIAAGSEMLRGLAATVYVNDCREVLVMPHTDCGVTRFGPDDIRQALERRGVPLAGLGKDQDVGKFFGLVADQRAAVAETVEAIRSAPFLPRMPVHAALMDVGTGALTVWERGY